MEGWKINVNQFLAAQPSRRNASIGFYFNRMAGHLFALALDKRMVYQAGMNLPANFSLLAMVVFLAGG